MVRLTLQNLTVRAVPGNRGSRSLLERPVDGATADPKRLGNLNHGDLAGVISGPGQFDLPPRELCG